MIKLHFKSTQIDITFGFLSVLTLFFLYDTDGYAIFSLLTILLHESGHILAFYIVRFPIKHIIFNWCGIKISKDTTKLSYKKELLVQSLGIITNLIVFITILPFILSNPAINTLNVFGCMNLLIAIFNLLPIPIFDGYKIFNIIYINFLKNN